MRTKSKNRWWGRDRGDLLKANKKIFFFNLRSFFSRNMINNPVSLLEEINNYLAGLNINK